MGSLTRDIQLQGGVASIGDLRRRGHSERLLRSAIKSGLIATVRKGWVRIADADPGLVGAVELGGRLGCSSAAKFLGWWTLDDNRLHIAVPRHAGHARARTIDGVVAHWQSANWGARPRALECVDDIARQLLECGDTGAAVVTLESALNKRALTHSRLMAIAETMSAGDVALVHRLTSLAESGLESLTRLRLERSGIPARSQVRIPGVGRVDLLIGDRLIIETDGRQWHSDPAAFTRDRDRDLLLALLGYRVLRFTYAQVMRDWRLVELTIRSCLARGEHRF